jgi:hypothetical protein
MPPDVLLAFNTLLAPEYTESSRSGLRTPNGLWRLNIAYVISAAFPSDLDLLSCGVDQSMGARLLRQRGHFTCKDGKHGICSRRGNSQASFRARASSTQDYGRAHRKMSCGRNAMPMVRRRDRCARQYPLRSGDARGELSHPRSHNSGGPGFDFSRFPAGRLGPPTPVPAFCLCHARGQWGVAPPRRRSFR